MDTLGPRALSFKIIEGVSSIEGLLECIVNTFGKDCYNSVC